MAVIDQADVIHNEPTVLSDHRRSIAGVTVMQGTFLGLLRLTLGWTFLWGFLDKLFGLGFDTCRNDEGVISRGCDAAFVNGGSPTFGFLNFATKGSKTGDLFAWMAPSAPNSINLTDLLFLGGLLFVGVCLTLGIAVRLAGVAGALMMIFIYLAGFVWPEFNPIVDQHIVQAIACLALAAFGAGQWLGLGAWWSRLDFVERSPIFR